MIVKESPSAGYREIEHTADWELEVWAPDLPGLLEQAALGMYKLSGTCLRHSPRRARQVELDGWDAESLLVAFLDELLWLGEREGLGFDQFKIMLDGSRLSVEMIGAPIEKQTKEIKAVTFHNLNIERSFHGLIVRIVFDV